jgi:DNA (cytosine-5)-methyltransferase 1
MARPRLLDLFCGAGGAAVGYHRAGFEVVGVDINPQPRYPFKFVQDDAVALMSTYPWWDEPPFHAIHASPPCPRYSMMTKVSGTPTDHPDLMEPVRELLSKTGLPYVIENVVGAPMIDPVRLCGSSLGLGAKCRDGKWRQLRRHRLFETNFPLLVPPCSHEGEPVGVYGHGGGKQKTVWSGGTGRGYMATREEAFAAMGIDWMLKREVKDAIPPAYTEFIGGQLMASISSQAA